MNFCSQTAETFQPIKTRENTLKDSRSRNRCLQSQIDVKTTLIINHDNRTHAAIFKIGLWARKTLDYEFPLQF